MNSSDEDDDDFIAQQAALAAAKHGLPKKNAMIKQENKKFDSADHEMELEQLRSAAGLAEGKKEEEKKE